MAETADTERIELPDGAWVEIRTVVTRRMRKAFRKAGIASVMVGGNNGAGPVDLADPEALKAHIMAHPEGWNLDAVDDAFLLHGIVAYHFPGGVSAGQLTLEVLDGLPASEIDTILARLRELYAEATPELLKN